jgi:hypothetical protein
VGRDAVTSPSCQPVLRDIDSKDISLLLIAVAHGMENVLSAKEIKCVLVDIRATARDKASRYV